MGNPPKMCTQSGENINRNPQNWSFRISGRRVPWPLSWRGSGTLCRAGRTTGRRRCCRGRQRGGRGRGARVWRSARTWEAGLGYCGQGWCAACAGRREAGAGRSGALSSPSTGVTTCFCHPLSLKKINCINQIWGTERQNEWGYKV